MVKKAATALENCTEESLTFQSNIFRNIIDFVNNVTKEKLRQTGEQHLRYNMMKWVKKGAFDLINGIRENVTLAQLMDDPGNLNHAISIVRYWILESKYERELHMPRESLDLICSTSVGE